MARKHHLALPTRADFDPTGVDVEAQAAAEVLGGKTIEQARAWLSPLSVDTLEPLMWMGPRALAFYLPVAIDVALSEGPDLNREAGACLLRQVAWRLQCDGRALDVVFDTLDPLLAAARAHPDRWYKVVWQEVPMQCDTIERFRLRAGRAQRDG